MKIWHADGTLHADIRDLTDNSVIHADFIQDDSIEITSLPKPVSIGWTCSGCGMENQTGTYCNGCGTEIRKTILYDYFEQTLGTPVQMPYYEIVVYEHTDDKLIIETYTDGGMPGEEVARRFASPDLIKGAEEIITKFDLRTWNDRAKPTGMCGGINVIKFKDGDGMIRITTDNAPSYDMRPFAEMKRFLQNFG